MLRQRSLRAFLAATLYHLHTSCVLAGRAAAQLAAAAGNATIDCGAGAGMGFTLLTPAVDRGA